MRIAYMPRQNRTVRQHGFTIVELLIVIIVIAILAAITIVAYNGITRQAAGVVLQSDLKSAQGALELSRMDDGAYPDDGASLPYSPGTTLEYTRVSNTYCLTASSDAARTSFFLDSTTGQIVEGACTDHHGYTDSSVITAISAGYDYSCALAGGKAFCWGKNNSGQLGNGSTADSNVPVAVSTSGVLAGKTITAISAASGFDNNSHTCAIADGQAYCWGRGDWGRLGNGSTADSNVPVAVSTSGVLAGKTITAISANGVHACAIAGGQAYCWGRGDWGRLGNNFTSQSNVPVAVSTSGVLAGKTVTDISAGYEQTCSTADGQAYCWGEGGSGRLGSGDNLNNDYYAPIAVSTSGVLAGKTVTDISTGRSNTCAIADGQAFCWGYGGVGQIGDGSTATSNAPVAISTSGALAGKTVTDISPGDSHICAIAGGQAYCWGVGGSGRLGNGSAANSKVPVAVSPLPGF